MIDFAVLKELYLQMQKVEAKTKEENEKLEALLSEARKVLSEYEKTKTDTVELRKDAITLAEKAEKLASELRNIDDEGIAKRIEGAIEEGEIEIRKAVLMGIDEYAKKSKELVERMFSALSGFEKETEKLGKNAREELDALRKKVEEAMRSHAEYFEILKEKSKAAIEEVKASAGFAGFGKILTALAAGLVVGYILANFFLASKIRQEFYNQIADAFTINTFINKNAPNGFGIGYTKDGMPYMLFRDMQVECRAYGENDTVCFLQP